MDLLTGFVLLVGLKGSTDTNIASEEEFSFVSKLSVGLTQSAYKFSLFTKEAVIEDGQIGCHKSLVSLIGSLK